MIRAILFDKDGTLFDFEATFAPATADVVKSLSAGDPDAAGEMARLAGFDLARQRFLPSSVVVAGTAADLAQLWSGVLGQTGITPLAARIDGLYEQFTRHHLTLFPFADGILAELAASGLVLGVATNDAEAGARAHLEAAGIARHFSFVCGYDSGHGAKPGPGMVLAFARHCGVPPGEVMMVGDSTHDMVAGRSAGAVTTAVLSGLAGAEAFDGTADAICNDIGQLPQLLRRLAGAH